MSKLGKKVSDALDATAHAVVSAGHKRGPMAMAVANNASRLVLGRYWERCDLGKDCADPTHEHVDLD
jgi:hypothetical protein